MLAEISSFPGKPPAYTPFSPSPCPIEYSRRLPAAISPEPAAPTGKSQSKLSTVALRVATAGAIKSEQPTNWEGGSSYPRGSGSLMLPPRADSLAFKNRPSETGCAGLGQTCLSRKDVPRRTSLYLYISIYISIYRCPPKADSNSSLKHKASRSLNAGLSCALRRVGMQAWKGALSQSNHPCDPLEHCADHAWTASDPISAR